MKCSWRIAVRNGNGATTEITPESAPLFDVAIEECGGGRRLVCRNVPPELSIVRIVFPAIELEMTDDTAVLLSESQGLLVTGLVSTPEFTFRPDNPDYIYETRFRSMKFAAVMNPHLYIGINDSECFSKSADIYRSADRKTLHFDIVSYSSEMPFSVELKPFSGNWFDAAMLYKHNCRPLKKLRASTPLRDIAMWLWNRDRADNVIPPAERLQADSGVPVALDWYWYHKNPYDTGYPDYYPPREGVEKFTAALARLKRSGIFTQVYTNGFLWDTLNDDWSQGGSEGVIKDENGEMVATSFNVFMKHPMAYMCGCAEKFRAKLLEQISLLAACGLEGIYVDMIGCATMQFCYNPDHPHAPGGGSYMAGGYRRLLRDLHAKLPSLLISTEDCNETYMDLVDSVISVMSPSGERYGVLPPFEFVPAFSAVHHGDCAMYGSSAHIDGVPPFDSLWPQEGKWKHEMDWNKIAPDQFFVELGRSLIWGQQPMVANLRQEHLDDPKLADRYKFICDTAKLYHANREWLFDGAMLRPPLLECGKHDVTFIIRFIFTEEGSYRTVSRHMPVILHSLWESPNGEKALFMLNYTSLPQKYKCGGISGEIPPRSYVKKLI
ncbi:MAG: DUF6259 domain-containing protein [Victivallaceae bacterium]|nr:DUF6259 domain-containing protein [Victivallaceae bacterium]